MFNKIDKRLMVFLFFSLLTAGVLIFGHGKTEEEKYEYAVKSMEEIRMDQMDVFSKGKENGAILLSSPQCPLCRKNISELYAFMKGKSSRLFYLNTDNLSEKNKKEIKEKWKLDTVPSVVNFSDAQEKVYTPEMLREEGVIVE